MAATDGHAEQRAMRREASGSIESLKNPPQNFDEAVASFTCVMKIVGAWKPSYFGAAYSTRLRQAIKAAREACDRLEKVLDADEARATSSDAHGALPSDEKVAQP